jgi:hypothetical protein
MYTLGNDSDNEALGFGTNGPVQCINFHLNKPTDAPNGCPMVPPDKAMGQTFNIDGTTVPLTRFTFKMP